MGIDVFERDELFKLLASHPEATDFGQEIIPAALAAGLHLQSYLFDDYWENIGTTKHSTTPILPSPTNIPPSVSMMRRLPSTPAPATCRPASSARLT